MFIRDLETESQIEKYKLFTDIKRTNAKQAGIQIGGLFITLGISFVGGIATGFLMKISACKELDWMYNSGAKILSIFDKNKYKYFTIYNAGHTFPLDNPGEVGKIFLNEF